jgi:hypothetical protein
MEKAFGGGGGYICGDPFRGVVAAASHAEGSRRRGMDTGRIDQAGGMDGHHPGEPFEGGAAAGYAEGPRRRGVAAGRAHLAGVVEEGNISWTQDDACPWQQGSSAGAREVREQR